MNRTFPMLAAVFAVTAVALGPAHAVRSADGDLRRGQWFIDPSSRLESGLRLSFRHAGPEGWESWGTEAVAFDRLEGLTPSDFTAEGHAVTFRLRRDGGTLHCRGSVDGGRGAGTYELELDPDFPAELKRRGLEAPTEAQQVRLVLANAGLDLIDELERQGYAKPDLPMLVTMAEHGVRLDYVRDLNALGYRLGSHAELVNARDHGVDPTFIRGLADAGYRDLPFEKPLRTRDHGVDPPLHRRLPQARFHRPARARAPG